MQNTRQTGRINDKILICNYYNLQDVANSDGGYDFTCQHGPNECIGNILLACAKKYIEDQETYVNFNICVMTSADPPTSGVEVIDVGCDMSCKCLY